MKFLVKLLCHPPAWFHHLQCMTCPNSHQLNINLQLLNPLQFHLNISSFFEDEENAKGLECNRPEGLHCLFNSCWLDPLMPPDLNNDQIGPYWDKKPTILISFFHLQPGWLPLASTCSLGRFKPFPVQFLFQVSEFYILVHNCS